MASPNKSRQNEKVRLAILDAAFSLSGELGYDKLTIEGIAKRAGAGKQTIYRWWSSKALVLLDALVERIRDELVFTYTGDVRADLIAQMRRVAKIMNTPETGCPLVGLLVEAQFDQVVADAMNAQIYEPAYAAAAARLEEAQRDGELAANLDPLMMVELLYAPLYYRLIVPYRTINGADIPVFLDMMLDGLRPKEGTGQVS
ncbi:TetR/AcrR family transcriptional regulator [Nitratireductor sp. ac15]